MMHTVSSKRRLHFSRKHFICCMGGCVQQTSSTMAEYMHPLQNPVKGQPILVQEFRGGSWDHNMAETLEFVNTKLECKGQLIDIALSMSNTDWKACIFIYYYKDITAMKQFGRTIAEFTNHGHLMCAWKRYYRENWYGAAMNARDSVRALSKCPGKLFSIKHACGNHAYSHGGAVTFVLYWQGIKSLPSYSHKYILRNWTRDLIHEIPDELKCVIIRYLVL